MKTIVLDLDGTLLTSEHEVDPITKECLINVQKNGHRVILCSGRSYTGMEAIAEELKLDLYDGYVISYNGGEAVKFKTKQCLFRNNFTKENVEDIYDLVGNLTENYVTYSPGKIHSKTSNARVEKSAYIMNSEIDHNIIVDSPKIVLQDEEEVITSVYEQVKDKVLQYDSSFNVFRSVPQLIEITPYGSDKGHGLEKLLKLEKIETSEIIAFGDGENDLTLLQFAHIGVAMGNAMDSVKEVADRITDTNDNYGIIKELKNILGDK